MLMRSIRKINVVINLFYLCRKKTIALLIENLTNVNRICRCIRKLALRHDVILHRMNDLCSHSPDKMTLVGQTEDTM